MAVVFDLRQAIGHGALARPISTGRDLLSERLMRPFKVVDFPPSVESALCFREITKAPSSANTSAASVRWNRSFLPRLCGWYGRLWMTAMPSLSSHTENRVHRSPDKSPQGEPLSTKKASGKP